MNRPLSLILARIPIIEFERFVAPDLTKYFWLWEINVGNTFTVVKTGPFGYFLLALHSFVQL